MVSALLREGERGGKRIGRSWESMRDGVRVL
jgi:hypothetical protein